METLPYAAAKSPVVVMIPLSDLFVPDWNPRKVIIPLDLANLVAFMKAGGKPPRITVWKGDRAIIEGQMRFLAAQQLALTHMEAEVVDCTLEEAKEQAFTSNNQNKPFWLDTDLAIEARYKELKPQGVTQEGLAGRLGKSETKISIALKIAGALTPASKELIYQSLQKTLKNGVPTQNSKNKGFLITEHHLLALADLEDPTKVEKALRVVLDEYLSEPKTKELVKGVKEGQEPEEYIHQKPVKAVSAPQATKIPPDQRPQADGHGWSAPVPKQGMGGTTSHTQGGELAGGPKAKEVLKQGVQAHQKGASSFLKWVGKGLGHAIGWCWGQFWKVFKDSIKATGEEIGKHLGKTGRMVIRIALIIALIWVIWTYLIHPSQLFARAKAVVEKLLPVFQSERANPAPTVSSAPISQAVALKAPVESPKPKATRKKSTAVAVAPVIKSQPLAVWSSADEPLDCLLDELDIIPQPCVIKAFTPALDTEISVDMATRRTNDLSDSERYKAFIGHDRQTIVSATPNPSGLTLNFKGGIDLGTLSGGLLGGAANNALQIYWEDLKIIHCSQFMGFKEDGSTLSERGELNGYQCSLVVAGIKKPFTVQCASAEDCSHLVSALQFWIRTARKNANAAMADLPYLNQGIGLKDDAVVKTLWENSPAQKAGVQLGERIWSVETPKPVRLDRGEAERGLQAFGSGPHSLFVVTQADWDQAGRKGDRTQNGYLRPKLYKLNLMVP